MREIVDKAREGVRESERFDLQASLVEQWGSMSSGVEMRLGGKTWKSYEGRLLGERTCPQFERRLS